MKAPESFVDAVDHHARRTAAADLLGDRSLRDNQRTDRVKSRPERVVFLKVFAERLAKKSGRDDDSIRPTELHQQQIAQAAAHRVADEQRAREHRNRRRDAGNDSEVGPPIVRQAPQDEVA